MSNEDPLSFLDEEGRDKIARMFSSCEEIVGIEHVARVISGQPSHSGTDQLNAYIGLEPSGKAHLGWMILSETMRKMLDEGVNITVLLADWHAWVNDKFSRDMDKISLAADYMSEVFRVLLNHPKEGNGPGEVQFIRASEIMDSGKYWERVLRCSKNMSLSRVRRTFSIMGRDEDSSDHDLSAFFYPALQSADIFELEIDIAFGGMDQRKAHMYMREVADRNKWTKATCIHTPMLSGLKGAGGRMDSYDHKMSKSDPNNAILLHDNPKKLDKKLRKAFLEIGNNNSAIYEIARHVLFPRLDSLKVEPKPEFGQPSEWHDVESFVSAVNEGTVHPFDAKMAISRGLSEVLMPISEYFSQNPDLLDNINSITGSQ
jgi:tyrosyl-tRNA synthetase|tara:strand:+ start:1623 stop:2741 length:1119 start_codon:yes stop_codon:yes gene_type:complete